MKFDIQQLTTRWPKIPLGDLATFLDSKRKPIKAAERKPGPYPYYGANGLQDYVEDYLFDEKLVLLAEDGGYFFDERPIAYLVEGKCWVNNHAHVLRVRDLMIPEFLNYQLGYLDVKPFLSGSTRAKLTKSDASRIELSRPPRDEQQRIVDVLARAEGIVRLRREAQQKAAELIPALFLDLFGDPATNPKHWPVVTMGELIADGPQNGLYKHKSLYGEGTPILRIDGFYDGVVRNLASLQRVRMDPEEIKRYGLASGDIVINRVNSPEYLGKSALIPDLQEPTVFESNMMRFRIDTSRVISDFVIATLQTGALRKQILAGAKHAINQSSINQQDVKGLRFPLPSIELQRHFAAKAAAVRSIAAQQSAALSTAQSTFAALLHRAFVSS